MGCEDTGPHQIKASLSAHRSYDTTKWKVYIISYFREKLNKDFFCLKEALTCRETTWHPDWGSRQGPSLRSRNNLSLTEIQGVDKCSISEIEGYYLAVIVPSKIKIFCSKGKESNLKRKKKMFPSRNFVEKNSLKKKSCGGLGRGVLRIQKSQG